MRGARVALVMWVGAAGCGGGGTRPSPSTTQSPSTTAPAPTTTVAAAPTVTAEPIPGLQTGTVHGLLEKIGFARSPAGGAPGFVTTTSKRTDATVSTYGAGSGDVVKIVAEADKAAAPTVLATVARSAVKGSDARRADAWVRAELKKRLASPTQPRSATATYGRQPYELLVTSSTATLSIGRLTG